MKKIFLLIYLFSFSIAAEELHLTPLLNGPTLKGMCEQYPDACKKSPTIIKPQEPIAPLMSRKRCIVGGLYYEVIINEESIWQPILDDAGLIKHCKS